MIVIIILLISLTPYKSALVFVIGFQN